MKKQKAIFLIGGGLTKDKDGRWHTTNFNEGDNFGVMGDRLRVIAASYLYKDNPDFLIIASGGKGQNSNILGAVAVSAIIKKELEELKIPAEKIIEENNSNNTWQQLRELKKIILERKLRTVVIVSNKYHLPRVQAMIERDKKLREMLNNSQIKSASAEEILIKYKPKKWRKVIEAAYKSEAMRKRVALERKGLKQIKEGTYKFK